jgi:hypothetical protein
MTMLEFKLLTQNEQIDLLYAEGIYIGKRKKNDQDLVLYQLESFYVEIIYHEYRKLINKIRCFNSTSLIEPYLEQIFVENLV